MKAIVNLSTDKYRRGQQRLAKSLDGNTKAHFFAYKRESEVGAESHVQNKYSFKPLCFKLLHEAGFDQILWLDASMMVIKNLDPIFDIIDRQGYFFQDSGWMNSRWTNRNAKEYFGTDEGEMISSGVLGINFNTVIGRTFFDMWLKAAEDGIFNGSHDDHRHDQTCASIIAHKLGMKITPNNSFWNYGKEPWHENILILADGIV